LEKSVDSIVSPVDVIEVVMSLRDRVVSVTLVAVDSAERLLLLVGTAVGLLLVTVLLRGLVSLLLGNLVSMLLGSLVCRLGGLVSVLLGGLVSVLLGSLVSVLLGSLVHGLGGLVGGLGLVGRSLRSGVAWVVLVRSKSGGRMSSGVVTVGGVRVIAGAVESSILLSLGVSADVSGVSPWVLGVLTVEVEMFSVSGGTGTDGTVVSVGVSNKRVVVLDFLSGVATPVVVGLGLVVGVGTVVVLLGGVGLGGIGALKVGWVVVCVHSGVDGLRLLVRSLVLGLVVVVLGGVSDGEKSKSE